MRRGDISDDSEWPQSPQITPYFYVLTLPSYLRIGWSKSHHQSSKSSAMSPSFGGARSGAHDALLTLSRNHTCLSLVPFSSYSELSVASCKLFLARVWRPMLGWSR